MWTNGDFRAAPARGLEQVQRAHRVGIEVVERDAAARSCEGWAAVCTISAGRIVLTVSKIALPVADVELVMVKVREVSARAAAGSSACRLRDRRTRPAGCCRRRGPRVRRAKIGADFGADEAGGTGDETDGHTHEVDRGVSVLRMSTWNGSGREWAPSNGASRSRRSGLRRAPPTTKSAKQAITAAARHR